MASGQSDFEIRGRSSYDYRMLKFLHDNLRSKAIIALVTVALFFTTSCADTFRQRVDTYSVGNTTTAVIQLFDDEVTAIKAMLLAADKGYTPKQIVKAIHDKTLTRTGVIPKNTRSKERIQNWLSAGAGGRQYALKDLNLLIALNYEDTDDKRSLDDVLLKVVGSSASPSAARSWVKWTLMAVSEGYSSKQIYEMLDSIPIDSKEPPTILFNGVNYAVVYDLKSQTMLTPKYADPDAWPFEDKNRENLDDFLNELAIDANGLFGDYFSPPPVRNKKEKSKSVKKPAVKPGNKEYKLAPYYANSMSEEWQINRYDIKLNLKVNDRLSHTNVTYYEVDGSFLIETSKNATPEVEDMRWVIEGNISPTTGKTLTSGDLLYVNSAYNGYSQYSDRELSGKNAAGQFRARLYIGGELKADNTFVGVIVGRLNEDLSVLNNGVLEVDSGRPLYTLPYGLKVIR